MRLQGHEVIFKEGSVGVFIQDPRDLFINGHTGSFREGGTSYYEVSDFIRAFDNSILFVVSALNLESPEYSTEYWRRIQNKKDQGVEEMMKKVRDVKEQYFDRHDNTRRYSEGLQTPDV